LIKINHFSWLWHKAVGIKNCLKAGWKWIYTPLDTSEQENIPIHQQFQELEKDYFEGHFLQTKQRLEQLFQKTTEEITKLRQEISELQQRLSKVESCAAGQQFPKEFR
jgi:septin family protein